MTELNIAVKSIKKQLSWLLDCGYDIIEGFATPTLINNQNNYVINYKGFDKQVEIAIAVNNEMCRFS